MPDWTRFSFFESAANVKRIISGRARRAPSTSLAREIAICFQQGRLFYQSAERSPLEIQPLLLFYGTVAFAKGLVMYADSTRLASLPKAHGVRDTSSTTTIIPELTVRVGDNGTFQRFNDVVARLNYLAYGRDAQNYTLVLPCATSTQMTDVQLTLKEILARVPLTQSLYRSTFAEPPLNEPFMIHEADGYWQIVVEQDAPSSTRAELSMIVADLRRRFPALGRWRLVQASRAWGRLQLNFRNVDVPPDELHEDVLGEYSARFIVRGHLGSERRELLDILSPTGGAFGNVHPSLISPHNGLYIAEHSLHYLAMFLLSSLVRYQPQTWVHAITRSETPEAGVTDHVLALLQQLMETHREKMPELVTELLNAGV